jgi:hypothetical protein
MIIHFSQSYKPFPTTSNALVVRHLVIHQTASDVVLGFIRWACGHPPDDDPDPIAGVTGWALSLHETKLLRVTDNLIPVLAISLTGVHYILKAKLQADHPIFL